MRMKKLVCTRETKIGWQWKEMNEEDYVLTSDNEQMNEPSNSDIRFVEQNNCTYKLRYYTVHLERGMVLEDIHICHTKKIYAL